MALRAAATTDPGLRRSLAAGLSATLSGVGLQRFAYAPLLPAMIGQAWLGGRDAGLLGAANLGGYLIGALGAGMAARKAGIVPALRASMLAVAACFALCAWNGGFWWLLPWRMLAGAAGGLLMGLAGPAVQAVVPVHQRGMAGGIVLTGAGIGIVAGAVIVPALLPFGLPAAWLALSAFALLLAVLTWTSWPRVPAPPRAPAAALPEGASLMVLVYALSSAAGAAHVLWWPDYAVRGLGHSTSFASALWLTYGAASVLGPSLCGRLADRQGAAVAFAWTIGLQCAGGALPLVWSDPAALFASSALAGGGMVGCTAVALARAKEIAGEASGALWRLSSAAWGAAQTAMGFGLAWLYGATGSHRDLFAASALCAGCAAVLSLLAVRLQRRRRVTLSA